MATSSPCDGAGPDEGETGALVECPRAVFDEVTRPVRRRGSSLVRVTFRGNRWALYIHRQLGRAEGAGTAATASSSARAVKGFGDDVVGA